MPSSSNVDSSDASPPQRRLLASTVQLYIGTAASQGSNFLRTFFAASVLGPEVWGVWLGLRLIVDYGVALDLGVLSALLRQVAVLRGRNDVDGVARTLRTGFTWGAGMGLLGGLAVLGYALPRAADERRTILLGIALLLFLTQLRNYYTCYFRGHQRFREASLVLVVGSLGTLASLPLLQYWGMRAFLAGMVGQVALELATSVWLAGRPSLGIDWRSLRRDLVYGLPICAIILLALSLGSIDRMVILQTLGEHPLGFYGVALIAVTVVQNLASVPTMVLTPRMAEEFGRTGRPESLVPLVRRQLGPLSSGFSVLVGVLSLALPVLVELFLPKYGPGVPATRIAILGAYGMVATGAAASTLGALDRVRLYLVLLLFDTAATYGLARLFVHFSPSLEAVAAGCASGGLLHMTVMLVASFRAMGQRARDGLMQTAHVLAPLAYAVAASAAAEWFVRRVQLGAIARTALAEALFVVFVSPLAFRVVGYVRSR